MKQSSAVRGWLGMLLGALVISAAAASGSATRPSDQAPTLPALAHTLATHLDASDATERYTACILLAELPASTPLLERLAAHAGQTGTGIDTACARYALFKLGQESRAADRFVRAYPTGEGDNALWRRHATAGHPVAHEPPPLRQLAALAQSSDAALDKLLVNLSGADGAHAESLARHLAALYRQGSKRVTRAAARTGTDLGYVKRIAAWEDATDG